MILSISKIPISIGRVAQFAIDLVVLGSVFIFAYLLRFDFAIPPGYARVMLLQLPLIVGMQWALLLVLGSYRRIWRFISLVDLPPFLLSSAITAGLFLLLRAGVGSAHVVLRVPYSIILMQAAFSFFGLMGVRVLRRAAIEYAEQHTPGQMRPGQTASPDGSPSRVVLIGAGRAGVMAARELTNRASGGMRVVGFLDDDPTKQGAMISGIPVLGAIAHIQVLVESQAVDEAVITIANAPREQIGRIVRLCEAANVPKRIIPALHEILSGAVSIAKLRPVQIEDLLGREEVMLDIQSISRFIAGKRVLVTGAGGSIGSEMVRQLHGFSPLELLLVERCEYALYEIHREMRARDKTARLVPVVADVGDPLRMEEVFARHRPQVVIHAAAYKHVPLMEANVSAAIRNNVLGTRCLAEAAGRHGVEVFVMISTDKAVNPTSVMGASKRLAELAVQELEARHPATRYVAVRFGNVLGSTGSVIPLFREQIQRGGPVTVTHPDMQRYFMTIPEAAQLVLQAAAMGQGGEIFVLDMGQPIRISDLARDMIRLSGLRPDVDIRIEYTGLRPGEKMFEELHTDGEQVERTRHPMIFIGRVQRYAPDQIDEMLREAEALTLAGDAVGLRGFLNRVLPEARIEENRAVDSGTI
jgi:FlaA1/EpsC-like NDP-sugar epimerase